MSCKEEYIKYIKLNEKNKYLFNILDSDIEDLYFEKYILPSLLENNKLIFKKIESSDSNNLSKLPSSFCKTLIYNYFKKINKNSI